MIAASSELFSRFDLLVLLVQKELKLKYKGTALGVFWSLLSPLLMMVVYAVVFSTIVRFTVPRYPIFLLAGLLPWTFFQASIQGAALAVVHNGHLVRRVRFPVEFLPLTAVLANLVNILPTFAILLVFALVSGQPLGPPLAALPLLLALQAVFVTGIGILLSAVTVYFRDLEHLLSIAVTVWFYATPVIYPLDIIAGHHTLYTILQVNPMTWLITSYQAIWHANRWPEPGPLALYALVAGLAWMAGLLVFRRLQGRFAEEV